MKTMMCVWHHRHSTKCTLCAVLCSMVAEALFTTKDVPTLSFPPSQCCERMVVGLLDWPSFVLTTTAHGCAVSQWAVTPPLSPPPHPCVCVASQLPVPLLPAACA